MPTKFFKFLPHEGDAVLQEPHGSDESDVKVDVDIVKTKMVQIKILFSR